MEQTKRRGASIAGAVVAVIAALAMAFALVAQPVAAWADATITINQSESGHTYKAYQVLTATVSEGSNHTNVRLSNVQWGDDVNGDTLITVLKNSNTTVYAATKKGGEKSNVALSTLYKDCNSAEEFAAIFDWASDNTALADTIADIINTKSNNIIKSSPNPIKSTRVEGTGTSAGYYTLTVNTPGYYFIGDGDSTNSGLYTDHHFLQIFNDDKSFAPKASTPTVEKKVFENTKYQNNDGGYGTAFNDTADYNIGASVPFKLIGTIPEMSSYNNGYQYQFQDTLSTSLTRPEGVKVYLAKNKDDITYNASTGEFEAVSGNTSEVTGQFQKTNGDHNSMTVAVNVTSNTSPAGANDLTKVPGIYQTDSNGTIQRGADGRAIRSDYNYIIVVFKATLNNNAAIGQNVIDQNTLGDQNKAGSPNVGNVNAARLQYSDNPNNPSEHANTDNDYVIVFTYQVELTKAAASNTEALLSGATFQLKNSAGQFAKINNSSHRFVAWIDSEIAGTDSDGNTTTLTSGSDGKFTVIGLDDGTYTLHEVSAPSGYNTAAADWTLVVSADTSNGQQGNGAEGELTAIKTTLDGGTSAVTYGTSSFLGTNQNLVADNSVSSDVTEGKLSATITNTQGYQLPQTGGAATLALMIAGLALVAAAIVIAVIRRRAHDEA